MTKIDRIREQFELRGWPSPPGAFTDNEILVMAEKTFTGNCILIAIAWQDFISEIKKSLPRWIVKLFNKLTAT